MCASEIDGQLHREFGEQSKPRKFLDFKEDAISHSKYTLACISTSEMRTPH